MDEFQTTEGHLLFYTVDVVNDQKSLYIQMDSPHSNLRRDSAELFIKETIPPLSLLPVSFECKETKQADMFLIINLS